MTLHTSAGCSLDQNPVASTVNAVTGALEAFTSAVLGTTCESSGTSNNGCAFSDTSANGEIILFNSFALVLMFESQCTDTLSMTLLVE